MAKMFQNMCKRATRGKQKEEEFMDGILGMAKALSDLQDRAVETYRPLVNDICSRKATKEEVDNLLTWMFDFVGNEEMLLLFKKVCLTYLYTYPEVVGFYIMEYRNEYDRESSCTTTTFGRAEVYW